MIAVPSLPLLTFAGACAGSIVFASVLGALLKCAAGRWPALNAHRSVWLMAQGAVVLVFVLACAPLPRSAIALTLVLPPATAEAAANQIGHAALAAIPLAAPAPPVTHGPELAPATLALGWLPMAWLGVYLAGLLWHAAAGLRTQRRWNALLRHQSRIVGAAELRSWPALAPEHHAGLTIRSTELPLSPMLLGVLRPCLLLPAHLSTLEVGQQRLIVAHELAHWRRRDPCWLMLSGALAMAFWFNRPLRRLDGALREAVELGCDDAVLAGRGSAERQGYAAALVAQMRLQLQWQREACAAPAFGKLGVLARVQRMQAARPLRLSRPGRLLAGAGVLGLAAASAALFPSYAVPAPALAQVPSPVPSEAPATGWGYPLSQVRVTSLYGVRSAIVPSGHHGVDFAARRGTPVSAVAAGTVVEAAFDRDWGHYVRVDHGGGVSSLLIHLERIAVAQGRRVAAGDLLGASGASGKATGPHLHLEYWRDGRRLDPGLMLAGLNEYATPKALARLQAQGYPIPTDQ